MKFTVTVLLSLTGASLAAFEARAINSSCSANNCLRAVGGTRKGLTFQAQATSDCQAFGALTVESSVFTVTVTSSSEGPASASQTAEPLSPRDPSLTVIPAYATAQCSNDPALYSSACACIGVTAITTTLAPVTITVTVPPSATTSRCVGADLQTDPNNCGSCGTVCPSGSCDDGSCVDTNCSLAQCGSFNTCGSQGQDCFCFSNPGGVGFCGQNASCGGLTNCDEDTDCPGGGYVCSPNTCCGAQGVCLQTLCDNPSKKLARAALRFETGDLYADTAAALGRQ